MIRRPPRSTLFPYTSSSDLPQVKNLIALLVRRKIPLTSTLAAFLEYVNDSPAPQQRALDAMAPTSRESRSEEHTSELQSLAYLVCRLLLEKKKKKKKKTTCNKNIKRQIKNSGFP